MTVYSLNLLYQEQSQLLWKFRDGLQKYVSNSAMKILLELNQQDVPPGESKVSAFNCCLACEEQKMRHIIFIKL